MTQLKLKQIYSDTTDPAGAVISTNGAGVNTWALPILGTPTGGSLTTSWYSGGPAPAIPLTPTTKIVDAVDDINMLMALLLPNAPASFAGVPLVLSSASNTALLATGYTSNSLASPPTAGSSATRVTTSTINTALTAARGSGMLGILTATANGTAIGTSFTFTSATGDAQSGVLSIANDIWGGTNSSGGAAPNGFYQTFQAQLVGAPAVVGLNTYQIQHSQSGNSANLTLVLDDLTSSPVVSSITAVEAAPVAAYSSGIKHYGSGSTFTVGAGVTNLSGQTYSSGNIITLTGPGTTVGFAPGTAGMSNPLAAETLSFTLTGQTFTVGGNIQSKTSRIAVNAYNPSGSGSATSSTNMLVLSGTGGISDGSITGPATTNRVYLTDASNTTATPTSLANSAWSSTQSLAVTGYMQEAAIVAGILSSDSTNYSTGFMPTGDPSYVSKPSTQYITYMFSLAARSNLTISITGSYSGLWVALPAVSNTVNALGGIWWNGMVSYNGSGLPGRSGDSGAGCAGSSIAGGGSGTFDITFGTGSSSSSTSNQVYVRIALGSGQSITALSIA